MRRMSVKHKLIEPNTEIDEILYRTFTSGERPGYIEVGDENVVMPYTYKNITNDVDHFDVLDSDIFVTSYPKSGTTWAQEMVWMIMNDFDLEKGKENLTWRFPSFEMKGTYDFNELDRQMETFIIPEFVDSLNYIANFKTRPRFIKTHLPRSLLPLQIRNMERKPKMIHVYRNPKDVCVSYYHYCIILEGYAGTFEEFCKLFLAGRMSYGNYWNIVLDYWNRRNEENIMFLTYQEMKRDLASVIRKVAKFLGKEISEDKIPALVDHLSFESMKNNNSVNYEDIVGAISRKNNVEGHFMRSGKIGSHKEDMSQDMIDTFDKWIEENCKGTDFII